MKLVTLRSVMIGSRLYGPGAAVEFHPEDMTAAALIDAGAAVVIDDAAVTPEAASTDRDASAEQKDGVPAPNTLPSGDPAAESSAAGSGEQQGSDGE